MKVLTLVVVAAVTAGGCGGENGSSRGGPAASSATSATMETGGGATRNGGATSDAGHEGRTAGTTITVADSQFGRMLYDSRNQAIYIFENDPRRRSVCYGECSRAWPPVLTDGEPRAGEGVRQALLGTTKRRGGTLQVTYAGKPLYFYANEGRGEVRCHNVDLNGGLWWVVGPDGDRLP